MITEDQPTPELPELRVCASCACFSAMTEKGEIIDPASNPEAMRVCRRNPPGGRMVRVEEPVHDPKTGAPVVDRGRPRLQAKQVLQIGYQPTIETASCYDGWRPLGTPPGQRWESRHMVARLLPLLERALVQSGMSAEAAEQIRDVLTGLA